MLRLRVQYTGYEDMIMVRSSIADEVDRLIQERSLLTHPFYQAWQRGALSLDSLRCYAEQHYHHVLAFPQYVSAAHASCPDQRALQFFTVPIGADEWHAAVGRGFVERHGATPKEQTSVRETARRSLDALWGLLDGVYSGAAREERAG